MVIFFFVLRPRMLLFEESRSYGFMFYLYTIHFRFWLDLYSSRISQGLPVRIARLLNQLITLIYNSLYIEEGWHDCISTIAYNLKSDFLLLSGEMAWK